MSKQQRAYTCPNCGGRVQYPKGKRLSMGVIQQTQSIHDNSCPGGRR